MVAEEVSQFNMVAIHLHFHSHPLFVIPPFNFFFHVEIRYFYPFHLYSAYKQTLLAIHFCTYLTSLSVAFRMVLDKYHAVWNARSNKVLAHF